MADFLPSVVICFFIFLVIDKSYSWFDQTLCGSCFDKMQFAALTALMGSSLIHKKISIDQSTIHKIQPLIPVNPLLSD
jgi:hypothetical protein